ncbi:MAG: hypothetical protein EOP49_05080, partial [Sphingobacteriales bacterium]
MKAIRQISLSLIFLIAAAGYAQHFEEIGGRVEGAALTAGQPVISVTDPLYSQLGNNHDFTSKNSAVLVNIGFNNEMSDFPGYNSVYSVSVNLLISRISSSGTTTVTKSFQIFHDKTTENVNVKDFFVYKLPGTHKATAKVLSVTYYNSAGQAITLTNSAAFVELRFVTDRYYNIKDTNLTPVADLVTYTGTTPSFAPVTAPTNNEDELRISWTIGNNMYPAIEYELEWAWIDNFSDAALGQALPRAQIPLTEQQFRLNSTRVETTSMSYSIPLVFSRGYLVYRVRPVGRFLDDVTKKYFGSWTSGVTDSFQTVADWPHVVEIGQNYESGQKNWQYQSSFAEGGKKKEVVSYFDGSLRNRQTVTKSNTSNRSIAGEVIYDNQGRAAIEVLPVPLEESAIRYFDRLSANGTTAYSRYDFDWDMSLTCTPSMIAGMNKSHGASKYYSELMQPDATRPFQEFVPNADGYPFSQTEYTPDNTGRIRRKGGVGPTHQIGAGHEMAYYYFQPEQEELNRLFGYKVGDFGKYKKNMVVDPNGQVSVSYLDPEGRTIATALAGNRSGSMLSLPDEQTPLSTSVSNLLANNDKYATGAFGILKDGLGFSSQIGIDTDNSTITLAYALTHSTNTFHDDCFGNKHYPFVYNLSMTLRDDCGFDKIDFDDPTQIGATMPNNTTAGLPLVNFSQSFTVPGLNIGTYTLGKHLKVDPYTANVYADDYIATIKSAGNPCVPDPVPFTAASDVDGCNITCNSCEKYLVKPYLTPSQYTAFEQLFPTGTDGNTLGSATNVIARDAVLADVRKTFVISRLADVFPGVAFTYSGSTLAYPVSAGLNGAEVTQYENNFKYEFDNSLKVCRQICAAPVSICSVSEMMLLSDVSPNGQYGLTEGITYDVPEESPVGGEEEEVEVPDDVPAPVPTMDEIQQDITSELSVFNEYNKLLRNGTSPIGYDTMAGSSAANVTVMEVQSLSSWKYPSPVYADEQGVPAKVPIVEVGTGVYSPPIEPTTPQSEINALMVSPQYLDNVKDFLLAWNPSWAKSLIKYHPEYPYLTYYNALCSQTDANGLNTDSYDEQALALTTYNAANTPVNGVTKLAQMQNTASDPFYSITYTTSGVETSTMRGYRLAIMNEALTTNFEGMLVNNLHLNMFQAAVYTVLFGNGLGSPGDMAILSSPNIFAEVNNLTTAQQDRIWLTFRNYYLSMKQKTKTVFSNIYALQHNGYNGCIGDMDNIDNFVTLFHKYNHTTYQAIVGLTDPLLPEPAQAVCSSTTAIYYAEKTKRFVPADTGFNTGESDAQTSADAQTDADSAMFLETGKCPLLLDIQNLLNGLINRDYNTYSSLVFPAQAASLITPFSGDLFTALGGSLPIASGPSATIAGQLVANGQINLTVNNFAPITLRILPVNNYYSPCSAYTVAPAFQDYGTTFKIKEFKNIYYVPSGTPGSGLQTFQVTAVITRMPVGSGCEEEVVIEGTTGVLIGNCSFEANGGLSSFAQGDHGAGCDRRVRFEKNLVQLLNNIHHAGQLTAGGVVLG